MNGRQKDTQYNLQAVEMPSRKIKAAADRTKGGVMYKVPSLQLISRMALGWRKMRLSNINMDKLLFCNRVLNGESYSF